MIADPAFQAHYCYAVVMCALTRFEIAPGRCVNRGFDGHQIDAAPHAFQAANAFHSEANRALMPGYFRSAGTGEIVFTGLPHHIVARETTPALLDGIRDGFTCPSTPDQAAFHEGPRDVVALLAVLSPQKIVTPALQGGKPLHGARTSVRLITMAGERLRLPSCTQAGRPRQCAT